VISEISTMNASELRNLVSGARGLDELEALAVLRNPYCSVDVATMVAARRDLLDLHAVRERLAGFPGMPFSQVMSLMATLPWTSLLALGQSPKTPPLVRRQADKKLIQSLQKMSLGEKIALARRAHRPLLPHLMALADVQVLEAVLDNPRLVETDLLVLLRNRGLPEEFVRLLGRHHRWGVQYRIRRAMVESPSTPLPVALSALVSLRPGDLARFARRRDLPERIRNAAQALQDKAQRGERRVIRSDGDGGVGQQLGSADNLR
jgi:hypothetical protein